MNKEQLDRGNEIEKKIDLAGEKLGLCETELKRIESPGFGSDTNEKCVLVVCYYKMGAQSGSIEISPETMIRVIKIAETQIKKDLDKLIAEFKNL